MAVHVLLFFNILC